MHMAIKAAMVVERAMREADRHMSHIPEEAAQKNLTDLDKQGQHWVNQHSTGKYQIGMWNC